MTPLCYAILWHDGVREPHFDLMFETFPGSTLSTWRSASWPIERVTALTRLKDHRRFYLGYEGELSERRGRVTRVAGGTCALAVGEGQVWTVRLITGAPPQTLRLRAVEGERWEIEPMG